MAKRRAARFNTIVEQYCNYAEDRANILTIRYESLAKDKPTELRRLFSLLVVDASPQLLERIVAQSSRENMAAQSTHPAFFGLDESEDHETKTESKVRTEA